MTNYTPKANECSACFDKAYYMAETDAEGRCLTCHKQLYPEGCRPLTKEEKDAFTTNSRTKEDKTL